MSLIWVILINTIIGMVLFPISILLIIWYTNKKYGIDMTMETAEDNLNNIEDFSTVFGVDNRFIFYLNIILSIVFWEIMIPITAWVDITKTKDLHEIRGGDSRKITRIKDLKVSAVKADIRYAKTMIEVSKKRRERDIEILSGIAKDLDPMSEQYLYLITMIEFHKNELNDFDLFLQNMKKYH